MLYIGSLRFHALKQKSIRVRAVKAKPKALRHFKVDTPVLKIDETVYNLYGLLLSGSVSLQIVIAGNGFSSSDDKLSYLSVIKLFPDLIKQNDMNIWACGKSNM